MDALRAAHWRLALPHIAAHLLIGLLFLSPGYVRPDSVGAASWLRSAVFDGDLLLFDEWAHFDLIAEGHPLFKEVTERGTLANHWGIGSALVAAPPYLAAHGLTQALGWPGAGFRHLYGLLLAWLAVACGAAVSLIAELLLRDACGIERRAVRLALVAALFVGTPLAWYELRFAIGAHLPAALALAVGAWLLARCSSPGLAPAAARELALGMAFGLAAATRTQHVLLLPLLTLFGLLHRKSIAFHLRAGAGALLALGPCAAAWQVVYGTPLGPLAAGGNASGATWAAFEQSFLAEVLLSPYAGLFVWSPLLLGAVAGWLVALGGRQWRLAVVALAAFTITWMAAGLLDRYFWAGTSFGARRFVDLAAFFALGLGWLAARVRTRRVALVAGVAVAAAACWTLGLAAAAVAKRIDLALPPRFSDLAAAVFSLAWIEALAPARLRSPVTHPTLLWLSLVAAAILAIVVAVGTVMARRPRLLVAGAAVYLVAATVFLAALGPRTLAGAPAAAQRYRLDPTRARFGPLLDQRTLLLAEAQWRRQSGDPEGERRALADVRRVEIEIETALAVSAVSREGRRAPPGTPGSPPLP